MQLRKTTSTLHVEISFYPSFKGEEFNKLLAVSGFAEGHLEEGIRTPTDKFVDLASSSVTCDAPARHPLDAENPFDGAVSTFIGNRALVCGGRLWLSDYKYSSRHECYFYNECVNNWTRGPDLPDGRSNAMGVMLDEKRWWIAGGKLL